MSQHAGRDPTEVWTIQRLLVWTADWLGRSGSATPRIDAESLLGHVLGKSRLHLLLSFDQPVQANELAAFKQLIRRRARHEPVAYIVGRRGFHDIDVAVTPAVLVPRPETETLVDFAAAYLQDASAVDGPVLDLCTGSGCVALALIRDMEKTGKIRQVWASDVSEAALDVARANAVDQARPMYVVHGDLYAMLPAGLRFAAIVSNPPYVTTADWQKLDADVRDFEPRLALDGGPDGLDVVRRIVAGAPDWLHAGGLCALEVGSRAQAVAACSMAEAVGFAHVRPTQVVGSKTHVVTCVLGR
ncbi:MAG: peptide chain release factor N(5)-glutamine methyltransferase [Deltaproteobacteria bacterium]|nr:peptide chain release factor N(5)-glutamine methyltransferase [Deltaproteobacteria bacterium]